MRTFNPPSPPKPKITDGRLHVSYSELKAYQKCPRQYGFKQQDWHVGDADPKRVFVGIVLERLVGTFYLEQLWRDPTQASAQMAERARILFREVSDELKILWQLKDPPWLTTILDTIPKILSTIRRERLLAGLTTVEHEFTLTVPVGEGLPVETIVHGRADFVFRTPDQTIILDGKGGASLGRYTHKDQLRLYALAAALRFQIIPRAGFWWYRHDTILWVPVSTASLQLFAKGLRATVACWATDTVFVPTPKRTVCSLCAFYVDCPEAKHGMTIKTAVPMAESTGVAAWPIRGVKG